MYVQCVNRRGTPTPMHAQRYTWEQQGCTGTVVNCVGLPALVSGACGLNTSHPLHHLLATIPLHPPSINNH